MASEGGLGEVAGDPAPRSDGVAVITGGSGGVGLACAELLGRERRVLIGTRTPEQVGPAVERLRAQGVEAEGMACDVTDRTAVRALADRAASLGPLAVLVHAAGMSRSTGDGPRIMEVNLVGTALVLDAFAGHAGPGTAAVCVASIGGHRDGLREFDAALLDDPAGDGFLERFGQRLPLAGRPAAAYDLSKRGVVLLAQQRAHEWARRGARLVSVSPGVVDTEMGRREGGAETVAKIAALGRAGTAAEIAAVIAFLCSPAASYVTGCDLVLDGGTLAGIAYQAPPEVAEGWGRLREEPA